ncbi:Rho GTPase-activating protein 22 [Galemys pyrenaicus]|uniref:Rho GTPase-activating protein 22 n=1 Tax=Galemys pyrenaicus TaxID=202257 RepID=A0A8J6AHT3_GALPY|nr:Rho GTPase-activating protein 22 [Galemys pyrenaicus]
MIGPATLAGQLLEHAEPKDQASQEGKAHTFTQASTAFACPLGLWLFCACVVLGGLFPLPDWAGEQEHLKVLHCSWRSSVDVEAGSERVTRSKSLVMGEQSRSPGRPPCPRSLGPVLKAGWLKKQRSIMKNWQQRWFVLRGDQLFYYKDKEETKPQSWPWHFGGAQKMNLVGHCVPGQLTSEEAPESEVRGLSLTLLPKTQITDVGQEAGCGWACVPPCDHFVWSSTVAPQEGLCEGTAGGKVADGDRPRWSSACAAQSPMGLVAQIPETFERVILYKLDIQPGMNVVAKPLNTVTSILAGLPPVLQIKGFISLQGTQVTELLPGPEDLGKHLFEIIPAPPERDAEPSLSRHLVPASLPISVTSRGPTTLACRVPDDGHWTDINKEEPLKAPRPKTASVRTVRFPDGPGAVLEHVLGPTAASCSFLWEEEAWDLGAVCPPPPHHTPVRG